MKRVVTVAVALLLSGTARADWKDLKPGMDPRAAWQCVGVPLMQYAARGTEIWTFDCGAYVQFENGHVTCWTAPKTPKPFVIAKHDPVQPVIQMPKARQTAVLATTASPKS
ncbi:MAG TPA: hypothetical protein VHE61_17745 [Opitutaceae bacterium]|nr:hypothetical protein [Opitutaceae bacterium]